MTNRRLDLVNNTGCNLPLSFERAIILAARTTGELPEELADLFTLEVIQNDDGTPRAILRAL